jgi:acyl carrier protein
MLADKELSEAQVLDAVRQIISENIGFPIDQIESHHSLENDLGFDSLDRVEIIMGVEEHFDISVPDSQADVTKTVADIVSGVMELLGRAQPT